MKILHILNSDFGARATMGVRSYHILKNRDDYQVFCRANCSEIQNNISCPFGTFRLISRGIQFLRMIHHSFAKLKSIEKRIFENSARKMIQNADIIHLFYHSRPLLDYAKSLGKTVIVEAFTNPRAIEQMQIDGIQLDYPNFHANKEEIYCYENCDFLISPSAWVSSTFKNSSLKGKLVEIPYGVDTYHKKSLTKNPKIKFCFAGGIKRTKGVLELLEAARELYVDYPDKFELHLYGRIYQELKKEIAPFYLDYIYFHGYENDIYKIYDDKDVYVFPSYFEGSSKTVLEAMAFGLPIVTTFNSGSLAQHDKNGYIVEVTSAAELFKAMRKFLKEPDLIKTMGEESLKIANENDWARYAREVDKVYKAIIEQKT